VEFSAPCAYPEAARKAGIQGRVWVFALVDTSGRVIEAQLERGIPELNAAALECVRRWRFAARSSAEPSPEFHGPVSYWVQVPITFTLH
jgi:protein TonB